MVEIEMVHEKGRKKGFLERSRGLLDNVKERYAEYKAKAPERHAAKVESLTRNLEVTKLKRQLAGERIAMQRQSGAFQRERAARMHQGQKTGIDGMFGGPSLSGFGHSPWKDPWAPVKAKKKIKHTKKHKRSNRHKQIVIRL